MKNGSPAHWRRTATLCGLAFAWAGLGAAPANAGQTINASSLTSCVSQGGVRGTREFITDFDNGTFGFEDGSPNQSPNTDPYPSTVTGGTYDNFYQINHGDYSYVANPVTPRNRFQHADITDPVYGATGRFFASDPNVDTPTLNFQVFNVIPDANYVLSFWAANSEPNGAPNNVDAVVDGITAYSTGPLPAVPSALAWQRHAFVFNAGSRTQISFSMRSTETGAGGRDFYLDNVELRTCTLSQSGGITGTVYSDFNTNDAFDPATDGRIPDIRVQLWDTRGTAATGDDIFVSATDSGPGGSYAFTNLAPNPDYAVRVLTTDPDLPAGASPGTPTSLAAPVTSGGTAAGRDFGFDSSLANLVGAKTVAAASSGTGLDTPGARVTYTISVSNTGNGPADAGSLFLVDALPGEVVFSGGAFGPGQPDPVVFSQSAGAGLDWNYARDVGFATAGPPPASFAACNYTPTGTSDSGVAYLCFAPNGSFAAGTPDPSFSVAFKADIR